MINNVLRCNINHRIAAQNAMSDTIHAEEHRLQAEIDALRARHPDTQELYREVCVLLFFRHGLTPTANKLYQLVRKGSMSAPAEALNRFWQTLRDKSRVRIEHPDLPEELRDAAGEAIGALWQRAQALADAHLEAARGETQAAVIEARAASEAAQARADAAEQALANTKAELTSSQARVQQSEQDLAREQGARAALERQVTEAAEQRRDLQRALEEARQGFEKQLDEQRTMARSADERHQADLRRILLDIDRERSAVTRLQKDLEQSKRSTAEQAEQHRAQLRQLQDELALVRQKLSASEAALTEARSAGNALRAQLEKALTPRPERKTPLKKSGPGSP